MAGKGVSKLTNFVSNGTPAYTQFLGFLFHQVVQQH